MTRINLFHAPSTRNSVAWGKTKLRQNEFRQKQMSTKNHFHPNHQAP